MGSLLHKRMPTPIALGIILAVVVAGLWTVSIRSVPGRSMRLGLVYQATLAAYAKDHGGRLPLSLRAPDFRSFVCHRGASETEIEKRFKDFERYYDVAWGTQPIEVDANGFIASRQIFLIQPAAQSPVKLEACKKLSRNLALKMKQIAATSSSPA